MPAHANILVILAQGLRADAYGAAGIWPIHTPDLDLLLHQALATVAVAAEPDGPGALTSLLTGLHRRQRSPAALPGRLPHWVAALHQAGYFCAGVGCLGLVADHLDASCLVADVTELDERACAYLRFADHVGLGEPVRRIRLQAMRRGPFVTSGISAEPMHDIDGFITDQAEQMLLRLPRGRPWLFLVALSGPGNDLPAPPAMLEQVGHDGLLEDFIPASATEWDDRFCADFPRTLLQQTTAEQARLLRRHYLARVLMLDGLVGRLREGLEEAGLAETTWLILACSRGKLLGEFGLFGGWSMLSPAVYAPLWLLAPPGIRIKGQPDHQAADGLVSSLDLAATVCDLAGVDAPPACIGRSLCPALAGQAIGHQAVLCEADGRLMIETLRHRAVFDTHTTRPRLLFDLRNDPRELHNLLDSSARLDILDSLRMKLANVLMQLQPA